MTREYFGPKYIDEIEVQTLNEKYGWFEFNDAQSDVSNAFANEAIARYERIRAAGPALLNALEFLMEIIDESCISSPHIDQAMKNAHDAVKKAKGV